MMTRPLGFLLSLALIILRLIVCCSVAAGEVLSADHLSVGIAVAEITPPVGHPLAGYDTGRSSKETHDPLYAKALVLRSRGASLALVSSDLHNLYLPNLVQKVQRELNIEHVILTSTYTHAAPVLQSNSPASDWEKEAEGKIFDVISTASKSLFMGRIGSAQRTLSLRGTSAPGPFGHNIRIIGQDGAVRERWSNPTEEGTAPTDPTLGVIRIDDLAGKPRVVIAHYACQPTVLGPANYAVSADYPGVVCHYVQRKLGENVVCMFVVGGAANIYPFRSRLSGPSAFEELEKIGDLMGMKVVETFEGIRMSMPPDQAEGFRPETRFEIRQNTRVFHGRLDPRQTVNVRTLTLLINRDLALMTVPGNLFVEFQLALRAKSPVPNTLLLGYAYSGGDWIGTVPTIEAAADVGDRSYRTEIEVGAGETMIDDAIIQLYWMLGKLDELPRGVLVHEIPDAAKTVKK